MSDKTIVEYQCEVLNNEVGTLNAEDGYDCDLCKNKGHIAYIKDDRSGVYLSECKCMPIRKSIRRMSNSGMSGDFKRCTFDDFKATEEWQKKLLQTAKGFCDDDSAKWFFIGGQVGCGKTHICTAIVKKYILDGEKVTYMLWCEESKRLKAVANDDRYSSALRKYLDAEILYIDDFLKTRKGVAPTDADINLAFEIINHRVIGGDKITIISSERTLDELIEFDEATMSRIFEKAGKYRLNIPQDIKKNYRLKGM